MTFLDYPTKRIKEGLVELLVPDPEAYKRSDGVFEPTWAPVFYNPRMAFNRDIAVLFANAYRALMGKERIIVVEPLAATGVRALRYALEAKAIVYASDISEEAYKLMKYNIEANNAASLIHVERSDANEFMYRLAEIGVKPDIVDIDPFGSPAPFIEAALHLLRRGGVLAVTATDVAPLSGSNLRALRRKYDVIPYRTPWSKEQALRILIGYIMRRAGLHDLAVRVLLAYYTDYYLRAYLLVEPGAIRSNEVLENFLSYAAVCMSCLFTAYVEEPRDYPVCPYCGSTTFILGPLYNGRLCEERYVRMMISLASAMKGLSNRERTVKLLSLLLDECKLVKPYVRIDKLCSRLRINMPKIALVVEELRKRGYEASRTHFDPRAIKTNAPHPILVETILSLARNRRPSN
ncbi:MAG: tRNA (guanine(10)-N(2))-dimethyltransferase [Pyrodictiaceae archaeon]